MNTPPLFVGSMLVFWGWMANLLPVGIAGAVILELSRLVKWRWDFSETDLRRAWDLSSVLFAAAAVFGYATTDIASGPTRFLPWLPIIFFPFVLAVTYSENDHVRFSTYFWLLRRKGRAVAPDKPLGWFVPYWYFVVCFIAASIVNARDLRFYIAVVVFGAWLLWVCRNRSAPAWLWSVVVPFIAVAGFGGHIGLSRLQAYIENRASQMFQDLINADADVSQTRTAIGAVGKLKQSNRIVLRVETDGIHPPPDLLRKASFNLCQLVGNSTVWSATGHEFGDVSAVGDVGSWSLAASRDTASVVTVSMFLLRGTGILPVPNGSSSLENLLADSVQTNRLGSTRVREAAPLVRYTVKYGGSSTIDSRPDLTDESVPGDEAAAVEQIANELDLAGKSPEEALRRVQSFFADQFTYRTFLKAPPLDPTGKITPLSNFLLHDRAGHCEFFATAATLLLRQAGVPARYAVGYAVPDGDDDDRVRVVRARHAHSWTLAYVGGSWRDFDTTPASWEEVEDAQKATIEPLTDLLEWLKYSFYRWRYYAERRMVAKVAAWVAGIVVLWFAWRIFGRKRRAKRKDADEQEKRPEYGGLDSEFYRIERHFAKAGIPRRVHESLGEWMNRLEIAGQPGIVIEPLRDIINLHYVYRFDPRGISDEQRRQLKTKVNGWLAKNAVL